MAKKYKRGFTVGTFDMFHIGHLNLVKQAKEYCDYLIVGIHSDEWVMHCKNRPTVINYEDRAAIVGAIRYVDEVVKTTIEIPKRVQWLVEVMEEVPRGKKASS